MSAIRRLLALSTTLQHLQLLWNIFESVGLVKPIGVSAAIAIVTGAGALVAQEPWYWITALAISVFAGVMVVTASIVVIRDRWQAAITRSDTRGDSSERRDERQTAIYTARSTFREHDGVLWADVRDNYRQSGRPHGMVEGPLCREDRTPLLYKVRSDGRPLPAQDDLVVGDYHGSRLWCPTCEAEFLLGEKAKSIAESKREVEAIFDGLASQEPPVAALNQGTERATQRSRWRL